MFNLIINIVKLFWRISLSFLILQITGLLCCQNSTTTTESIRLRKLDHEPCPFTDFDSESIFPPWQYFKDGNCTRDEDINEEVHLICVGGIEEHYARRTHYRISQLTIKNWPLPCFPPDHVLKHFPLINNLTIEDSSMRKFTSDFPGTLMKLKHLKLSNLPNISLKSSLFSKLPNLRDLDLRNNRFKYLKPEVISSPQNLTSVYLLNNLWNCSHLDVKWLSRQSSAAAVIAKKRIVDYKNLTCQGKMFKGKPLHVVMDLFTSLREECPKDCHCFLTNLVKYPRWDDLIPVSTVDCRRRGLTEFPKHIPSITTVLLLNGNNITDVRPLAHNPIFKKVADVYLDDNMVSTLRPLEGSDWLMSFRVFSIRGNNVTHIPNYAFDNAFQRNHNVARVFFGNNPWRCDCKSTPRFQDLLRRHQYLVQDVASIQCAKSDNENLSLKPIYSMALSVICQRTERILQPIDILNVILSLLILIVFLKFGYDYYNYKTSGKLPWLVDKIP